MREVLAKMKRLANITVLSMVLLLAVLAASSLAAPEDILKRWSRSETYRNDMGSELKITATYYSAEYIEALVQTEAEKNLWTRDEMENYKYELLKGLQIDEYIPVLIAFDNLGPALRMAPFDRQIYMWIGKEKVSPADYDKRFNFKVTDKREGLVFFPRYDENGESLLDGAKNVKLSLRGLISPITMRISTIDFIWDVYRDDPSRLWSGEAAAKLEIDRLIKRVQKLDAQKADLEAQLAQINADLAEINARIEELRRQ
jgi:hypothetical protein